MYSLFERVLNGEGNVNNVSCYQYYCYLLQIRDNMLSLIHLRDRLFQQYLLNILNRNKQDLISAGSTKTKSYANCIMEYTIVLVLERIGLKRSGKKLFYQYPS